MEIKLHSIQNVAHTDMSFCKNISITLTINNHRLRTAKPVLAQALLCQNLNHLTLTFTSIWLQGHPMWSTGNHSSVPYLPPLFEGPIQFPSGYFSLNLVTISGSTNRTPSSWLPRVILQTTNYHRTYQNHVWLSTYLSSHGESGHYYSVAI